MKRLLTLSLLLLVASNAWAEEESINLWKSFNYNMSTAEVIEKLKVYKHTSGNKKGKTGVKYQLTKERNQNSWDKSGIYVSGYCSISQNEQISLLNSSTYILWCFDKPSSKKNISSENKLKYMKIKFHNYLFDNSLIRDKYNRFMFRVSKELNLSSKEASICGGIGVGEIYDKGDVLLILKKEYSLASKKSSYWLYIQLKEDFIAGAKLSCLSKINSVRNNDDI